VLTAFPLAAAAQTYMCKEVSEQKQDLDADRQTLINLEQGITHAIQINNSSVVNTVFSDDFSGVTWFGEMINKAHRFEASKLRPTPTNLCAYPTFK